MRYGIKLDSLEVGARVRFKHVDMGASTDRGELVSWTFMDTREHGVPSFIAVRMPGYSMQMGAYAFTTQYVPAEIKFLRVTDALGNNEFSVESVLDAPLRRGKK